MAVQTRAVRESPGDGEEISAPEQIEGTEVEIKLADVETLRAVSKIRGYGVSPQIPIGEYGETFAKRLVVANVSLRNLADIPSYDFDRASVDREIRTKTRLPYVGDLLDGVESIVQALAQWTAYRVPGFDDPYQLLPLIAEARVVEYLAGILPAQVLGPMSIAAKVFPGPVLKRTNSGVVVAPELRIRLEREKRIYLDDLRARQRGDEPKVKRVPISVAGEGCPVARGSNAPLPELTCTVIDWMERRRAFLDRSRHVVAPAQLARIVS